MLTIYMKHPLALYLILLFGAYMLSYAHVKPTLFYVYTIQLYMRIIHEYITRAIKKKKNFIVTLKKNLLPFKNINYFISKNYRNMDISR